MCGVGAKSVAHLMKFHLLQWEVVKVKFLMNSNMTLTVLNVHQKTDPKVQQDFKGTTRSKVKSRSDHDIAHLHPLTNVPSMYQLPTPHGFQDIVRTRFYRSRSLWQRSNQDHTMTLHTYNPKPMSLTSINFLHLRVSKM